MSSPSRLRAVTVLTFAVLPIMPSAHLHAAEIVITDDQASTVTVADVALQGDLVVGSLMNQSGDELRKIKLLIDIEFHWNNDMKPGDDNPGRSVVLTVDGPLPPRGKIRFDLHPDPPLPARSDGRYQPKVHVMSYEAVSSVPKAEMPRAQ